MLLLLTILLFDTKAVVTRRSGTTRGTTGGTRGRTGGTTRTTRRVTLFRRNMRTLGRGSFMLRTRHIRFGHKRFICIAPDAGFISVGNSQTAVRLTFGATTTNPGKVKKVAISNDTSGVRVGASGGKGIAFDVVMRNITISTGIAVHVMGNAGGYATAIDPGFGDGHVSFANCLCPSSRSGIFGKHTV